MIRFLAPLISPVHPSSLSVQSVRPWPTPTKRLYWNTITKRNAMLSILLESDWRTRIGNKMDNFREALVEDEAETAIMESRASDLKARMKVRCLFLSWDLNPPLIRKIFFAGFERKNGRLEISHFCM